LLGVTLAMSVLGIAAAAYTPEKHDGVPKYYNSRVGYTDLGATVRIDSREFKGGATAVPFDGVNSGSGTTWAVSCRSHTDLVHGRPTSP